MRTNLPFEWEYLGCNTYRAKVIGGWVLNHYGVTTKETACTESMVFIADPNHEWRIENA